VREAIAAVFRRFDELGSARQVLLLLREDGLLLPRRRCGDPRISWAAATYPAVHDLLSNPAYAGAFVFGRTRTEKRVDPATRRVSSRVRQLPRQQWKVLIPDHHPGFIERANFFPIRSLCHVLCSRFRFVFACSRFSLAGAGEKACCGIAALSGAR
jgi:hypothetical protein